MLFYQPAEGYRYNSDSVFLYHFAKAQNPKGRLLDIGCGCGIIGLLLARDCPAKPTLIDKQQEMATLARKNAEINHIDADVLHTDLAGFAPQESFDFIVSNPPFYHDNHIKSQNESLQAARYTANLPFAELAESSYRLLANKGKFVFCYDSGQMPYIVAELRDRRFTIEKIRMIHPKIDRHSGVFLCLAAKNSRSPLTILPPLTVFAGDKHSPEAQALFAEADTYTLRCQL